MAGRGRGRGRAVRQEIKEEGEIVAELPARVSINMLEETLKSKSISVLYYF